MGTLHPSSCGLGVKTKSVVLMLTSSETMFVLKCIPAHPLQFNLLEMSWFIAPPVGFNYCLRDDGICRWRLAGCKGIRKQTHTQIHIPILYPPLLCLVLFHQEQETNTSGLANRDLTYISSGIPEARGWVLSLLINPI